MAYPPWYGNQHQARMIPPIGFPPVGYQISGPVSVGKTLTSLTCTTYQWQRGSQLDGGGVFNDIPGATSKDYVVTKLDIGYDIRCMGDGVASNVLRYKPEEVESVIEVWKIHNLPDGPLSSWVGAKQGLEWKQDNVAKQPVVSATAFNGGRGIEFDGVDDMLVYNNPIPELSKEGTRLVVGYRFQTSAPAATKIFFYGWNTVTGAYSITVSGSTSASYPAGITIFNVRTTQHMDGNSGQQVNGVDTVVPLTPNILSSGWDVNEPYGGTIIRSNALDLPKTLKHNNPNPYRLATLACSLGGNAFTRNEYPWKGNLGGGLFLMTGSEVDQDLIDAEAYTANATGIVL